MVIWVCAILIGAPGHNFHYFIGNDLTIDTISKFLAQSVRSISGSRSFIIETQTSYIIAALSNYNSWDKIQCNTYNSISDTSQYISVYRLCTSTQIDWIIVLSEPKWNTISSTIISIICSLVGSACVILLGVILGVITSLRLVKPFNNLINLFESVANMELELVALDGTVLSEVKVLQRQFISMVERIKLYKSFIPRHLLAELESPSHEDNAQRSRESSSNLDSDTLPSSLNAAHHSSIRSGNALKRSSTDNPNKFALHLEVKSSSFVQVHLGGVGQWLNHSIPPDDIVKLLSSIYHQLHIVARQQGGVVSSTFENECVTISFNTSTQQVNHPLKALVASSTLRQRLAQLKKTKWNDFAFSNHDLLDNIQFKFGVHSQLSYCGNIGTSEIKNYSIISSVQRNLEQLIRVAHRLCVDIVFSEKVADFSLSAFHGTEYSQHTHVDLDLNKGMKVYELGLSNTVNEDEWMYELQEKHKKSQWKDYNDACALLFENKYEEAVFRFKAFSDQHLLDVPSKYLHQQCIRKM
nr:unnamed protein product [Naegleria fowleri]